MYKIFLVASITFKDSVRNKALYGIFALGAILFTANMVVTSMFSWELGKVAVDVGLSVVSISGLFIIFFFSINQMTNDLDKKTVYLILSRPINKIEYILGKFIGLSFIIVLSSFILGICACISVKLSTLGAQSYIPQDFSWGTFFLSFVFLTLSLIVLMGVAFLCISVTTHPFTATLLCIMAYFIGQNIENVAGILKRSGIFEKNYLLTKLVDCASWVFPNLAAFDLKTTAAYGLPVNAASLMWVGIYGVAYTGVCIVLTIFIFQKRELG